MKIIAGEFGGRRIVGPRDASTTRPITGRVRTSLFDRLVHRGLLDDTCVLDVFAGTGTLGLEALSRGAAACLFVEKDRDANERLQRNIETLDVSSRAQVRRVDALNMRWLHQLPRPFADGISVAFVDPPYALLRDAQGWSRLTPMLTDLSGVMVVGGVLSLRVEKQVDVPAVAGWGEPTAHQFGSQKLLLFEKVG